MRILALCVLVIRRCDVILIDLTTIHDRYTIHGFRFLDLAVLDLSHHIHTLNNFTKHYMTTI